MSKLDEMYTALAPAKKDGYPVTQIAYDELQSALVTANERIRELEEECERERMRLAACGTAALGYFDGCKDEYKSASLDDVLRLQSKCTAEREVSNKLEKALKDTLSHLVAAASLLNRACEGLPDGALDGGWTAHGMSRYAKKLEDALNEILILPTEQIANAYVIAGEALALRHNA